MFQNLYASPDGSYTVLHDEKTIILYKNDRQLFKWDFSVQDFNFVGVSDNGKIASIMDNKFYLLHKDGKTAGPISQLSQDRQGAYVKIENMKINDTGYRICYEKITEKMVLNREVYHSDVLLYDLDNKNYHICWYFDKDGKKNLKFMWTGSKTLNYLAFLEKYSSDEENEFYKLHLYNFPRNYQHFTAKINEIKSPDIRVCTSGHVLMTSYTEELCMLTIFNSKGNKIDVTIPDSFRLYDAAKNIALLKHSTQNAYIFVDLKTSTQYEVDLSILEREKIHYKIFLTSNDEVVMIYKTPAEVVFNRISSPFNDFLLHIKRWYLTFEFKEKEKEEVEDYTYDLIQQDKDMKEYYDKVEKLNQAAIKHLNTRKEKIQEKILQIRHLLEKLNEQYLQFQLTDNLYKENRSKLMDTLSKLDSYAERLKIDITEELPKDLTNVDTLKQELNNFIRQKKIDWGNQKKWEEKIRSMEKSGKKQEKTETTDLSSVLKEDMETSVIMKEISRTYEKEAPKTYEKETPKTYRESPRTYDVIEDEDKSTQEKKILKLLDILEERFIKAEIPEDLFRSLRDKYIRKLEELQKI